jgi:hypothetical protein
VSRVIHAGRAARGYALLMVIFLAALMAIGVAIVMPNVITQGRRLREEEMIWRGEQYDRAIRLYYQKVGRFAPAVDDLVKGQAGIHFLRKAYKDPMNSADGTWRFIYVTQSGQLVGSIRYTSLAQMAAVLKTGGAFGANAGALPGAPGEASATPGQSPPAFGQGANPNPQNPSPGGTPGTPGDQSNPPATGQQTGTAPSDQPQAQEITEGPVIGGSLIGVASKMNRPSVKVYRGGKFYRQWEFIWNPLLDTMQALQQQGGAPGTPPGQPAGAPSPFGQPNPPPPQTPPPGQNPQSPPQP